MYIVHSCARRAATSGAIPLDSIFEGKAEFSLERGGRGTPLATMSASGRYSCIRVPKYELYRVRFPEISFNYVRYIY